MCRRGLCGGQQAYSSMENDTKQLMLAQAFTKDSYAAISLILYSSFWKTPNVINMIALRKLVGAKQAYYKDPVSMLSTGSALSQCLRQLSRSSVRGNAVFNQFFDDEANFGKTELRPKTRPGRSWTQDELRLKSNSDLHKLWYVALKEKNMLLTMQTAYLSRIRYMPNPERIDCVNETMSNIQSVIHERNDAFFRLETGDGADPPTRTVTSFMGFTHKKQASEHYSPAKKGEKEYEVPYLDDDAYMMQKLWAEKEFLKQRDRKDDERRRENQHKEMRIFQKGGPRVFNR